MALLGICQSTACDAPKELRKYLFPIGQQLADQFLCMVDTCNRNSSYKEDSSVKSKLPKDLISLFSFCWLIFRLGGTGLGLTEEVEDVGDLHRGELLAVLAIPFVSTSSWQFQGFAGTCLLPCLQLCFFPYLLPFLSGTCHPGGTGASWHQSQGLLSFLYRHQKTQKP